MTDKKQKIIHLAIISIIILFATGLGVAVGTVTWVIRESPDVAEYGQWQTSEATTIYTADGERLTRLFQQDREYVSLEDIPEELQKAIVAIEDDRFYEHHGIDLRGIGRAIVVNLQQRARAEGASTITQQLARNALLTHDKLFSRKLQEMYIALQFERMYTKNEILEFYLNEIFLGHSTYGVQSAAQFYFNKDVSDLNLSEAALIAGMPRSPNYYSPYNNLENALRRRNIVLNRMEELGIITAEENQEARDTEINLERGEDEEEIAPYFVEHIRRKLINQFGAQKVYSGGLEVHTTLDLEMQKEAEQAVENAFETYLPGRDNESENVNENSLQPQIGVLTMDHNNGHIKAMIGGRGNDKFNRTTQAHRQPGSAFKPFVYTESVRNGAGTGTVIDDTREEYKVEVGNEEKKWIPRNADDNYLGPTTAREGLARSRNVMAVKLLDEYGIRNTMLTAQEMGINNLIEQDRNLSLALGGLTRGVTMLEMSQAFGTLGSGGIRSEPISITEIIDNHGNTVYSNSPQRSIILEEEEAYLVTDMLKTAIQPGPDIWGTGWRANLDRPAAGKTGTSSNYQDAWFIGYTPELVTSVWIGEDSPSKMEYPVLDEDGEIKTDDDGNEETEIISSGHSARLWGDYMERALADYPVTDFNRPNDIISTEICTKSGKLPGEYCPEHTIGEELFIDGNEPTEECELHQETDTVEIDRETWAIATSECPTEDIATYEYQVETGIIVDDDGVPIRELDEETDVPLRDDDDNYIYKEIPEERCPEHSEEIDDSDEESSMQDKIWDFFNILRNTD